MTFTDKLLLRLLVLFLHLALWVSKAKSDDTARIQALLDNPTAFGVCELPPGEYEVGPMTLPPDGRVKYLFGNQQHPTVLKLKPNSGEWARVLLVSPTVPASIVIRDIVFDMNRDEQNWQGGFDLAHQAAIFLTGERCGSGFLDANISRVRISDSAGDGIYQHHKTRLEADLLVMNDIFRAGFAITGRDSKTILWASNFTRCGVDVEPNNPTDKVDVSIGRCRMADFDIALTAGSVCKVQGVNADGILYLYGHPASTFVCADSEFSSKFTVRLANGRFERCKFTGAANNTGPVMALQWAHGNLKSGLKFTLDACEVRGPGSIGVDAGIDAPANGNQLSILNSTITGTTKGAEAQKWSNGTQRRGLPWILTGSTGPDGQPLK